MSSRWLLAALVGVVVAALAHNAQADQVKRLEDCPVLRALSGLTGGRQVDRPIVAASTLARAGRGVKAMALAPVEVPATMLSAVRKRGLIGGLLAGSVQGVSHSLSRLTAGVLDVATSPVPGATLPVYNRKLGQPATQYGGTHVYQPSY